MYVCKRQAQDNGKLFNLLFPFVWIVLVFFGRIFFLFTRDEQAKVSNHKYQFMFTQSHLMKIGLHNLTNNMTGKFAARTM
jgi:hypothetical protein